MCHWEYRQIALRHNHDLKPTCPKQLLLNFTIISPLSAFKRNPQGILNSCSLGPHSHKQEEGKSKAELQSPGQEVRASGFSDPLAQLSESRLSTGHLLQPGPEEGTSGLVTLCISWQTGWTNVGLGEDEAQEMGSYWVPIYSDSVATKATPASLGGVKGKVEAARRLWRELTSPGLSKDRAPLLQAKSNAP